MSSRTETAPVGARGDASAVGGADRGATAPFNDDGFQRFLAGRDEPQWSLDRRRAAWRAFQELPWPSRQDEEWIRTDIRAFHLDRFALPLGDAITTATSESAVTSESAASAAAAELRAGVDLAGSTETHQGRPLSASLLPEYARRGVVFCSLDEAVRTHGDLVRRALERADAAGMDERPEGVSFHDRFAALHTACWSGGTFLYVPRGVVVDRPLHVGSTLAGGASDLGSLLVVLEEGAEATVLAECASDGGGLHCGAVDLQIGPRARLRFVQLQEWDQQVWHFAHQRATVDRDGSLQWTLAAIGSRLSKVNQRVDLVGKGAETQVNGVLFTEGRQHISYHTRQRHAAPECRSDFLYKAALQDHSRTVWRGMIQVDPGAQRTDGYQRNDNLLLTPSARADSIPGLEIEADDVRCTHGSTSGRVDEEQIFYARCRGFTRHEAVRMIVSGFFQQIFDRITIESVREALGRAIARCVREYD